MAVSTIYRFVHRLGYCVLFVAYCIALIVGLSGNADAKTTVVECEFEGVATIEDGTLTNVQITELDCE